MTSGNSSLAKTIYEQKAMLWRRLPLLALSALMYFLYDVFGTIIVLQRTRAFTIDETPFGVAGAEALSALMGFKGISFMICCTGAVILAVQGFAFLYKSETVDFYESRPEKRSSRFLNIVINSILIYLLPSLAGLLLSIGIAAVNGCAPSWLIAEMFMTWGFQTVLFLAVYGISSLCSLLTGTVVTALLMNLFAFGMEALVRLTILGCRTASYATFDQGKIDGLMQNWFTLPPAHFIMGMISTFEYRGINTPSTMDNVMRSAGSFVPGMFWNVAIFIITFAISLVVYEKRKSEWAGKAVVYRPLAVFIKFFAGIIFSLDASLIIYWLFSSDRKTSLGAVIFTIIITVVVVAAVAEAIFALNIRMAFNKAFEIPIIAALALIILFTYKSGITGYDRYLPKDSSVESAWLINNWYYSDYNDENGDYVSSEAYIERKMFLTDTDDLLALAKIGQEKAVEEFRDGMSDDMAEPGNAESWSATIGWRLKDGRIVTRAIRIPENVDPALMDRIISRDEFTKGVFHLDEIEEMVEEARAKNPKAVFEMSASTQRGTETSKENLLHGFLEAYRKDVSEHYDFTMASYNNPVGMVNIYDNRYMNFSWPVYECYDDTIDFLTAKGLWKGGQIKPEEVRQIDVCENTYDEDGIFTGETKEYTDSAEIEKIMNSSMATDYNSAWMRYGDIDNNSYSITVYPKKGILEDMGYDPEFYRSFYKDRIPGFVTGQ